MAALYVSNIIEIKNYIEISESIWTSGQPTIEQFAQIKAVGVVTVINLAMPDSESAIANEGNIVTSHGMNYIHIPVKWESPCYEQYELFQAAMVSHKSKPVWVHCALNWRVSSFIYCYKVRCLGVDHENAYKDLLSVWEPNSVWQAFIEKNV